MKLTPPTKLAFWISVVLAALGVLGQYGIVPLFSVFASWGLLVAYLVLLASTLLKGL